MEFTFNINDEFPTDVVVLKSGQSVLNLKLVDWYRDETQTQKYKCKDSPYSASARASKLSQERLCICIDRMGQKSAQAQGLREPITSAIKLMRSDHKLYIIKDASANNGMGALIGILKVGRKKLYLTNDIGNQLEVTPLCLLDFYVHESRQRQGYGARLFKVMLEIERIAPVHLAIDRPSAFLLSFLQKHYKLDQPQFHPNKYVIFPGFLQCIRGNSMDDKGTHRQIKSNESNGEQTSRFVALNQNGKLQSSPSDSRAYGDVSHAPPTSLATVKSCQRTVATRGRYDSDRKWQQMYDSWNVMGVPPRDYSYLKNGRHPPLRSNIEKNVMP